MDALDALTALASGVGATLTTHPNLHGRCYDLQKDIMLTRINSEFSLLVLFFVHASPSVETWKFKKNLETLVQLVPTRDASERSDWAHSRVLLSRVYRKRLRVVGHKDEVVDSAIAAAREASCTFNDRANSTCSFLGKNNLAHALACSSRREDAKEAAGLFEYLGSEARRDDDAQPFFFAAIRALHHAVVSGEWWQKLQRLAQKQFPDKDWDRLFAQGRHRPELNYWMKLQSTDDLPRVPVLL